MRDENGRRRKFTKDVFGRMKQVDELNWDQSVYSITTYAYNARDQITSTNQAGQVRSFAYDGHGRLQTRTTPEQGNKPTVIPRATLKKGSGPRFCDLPDATGDFQS